MIFQSWVVILDQIEAVLSEVYGAISLRVYVLAGLHGFLLKPRTDILCLCNSFLKLWRFA